MSDIFISYAREDLQHARRLAEALQRRGWSVWWDRNIPAGKSFSEVIDEALSEARCIVVVWSKTAATSDWVLEEAEEGRQRGILVPVFVEHVTPPRGFRRIQAEDLSAWDGTQISPTFLKLVADISTIIGPPPRVVTAEKPSTAKESRKPEAVVSGEPVQSALPEVQERPRQPTGVRGVSVGVAIIGALLGAVAGFFGGGGIGFLLGFVKGGPMAASVLIGGGIGLIFGVFLARAIDRAIKKRKTKCRDGFADAIISVGSRLRKEGGQPSIKKRKTKWRDGFADAIIGVGSRLRKEGGQPLTKDKNELI